MDGLGGREGSMSGTAHNLQANLLSLGFVPQPNLQRWHAPSPQHAV